MKKIAKKFGGIKKSAPAKQKDAPVAQLVEHLTLNQGVQGSSPCGCTNKEASGPPFFLKNSMHP